LVGEPPLSSPQRNASLFFPFAEIPSGSPGFFFCYIEEFVFFPPPPLPQEDEMYKFPPPCQRNPVRPFFPPSQLETLCSFRLLSSLSLSLLWKVGQVQDYLFLQRGSGSFPPPLSLETRQALLFFSPFAVLFFSLLKTFT